MASTLLNEQGFPPDVIELQLAHSERNKVRAAYNKAQRFERVRAFSRRRARGQEPAPNPVEVMSATR